MKRYIDIFVTMIKIGLFTFGGGYAMIALLEDEFIEKKKWISHQDFLDMISISESTPGPIAINAATYIGYKTLGFWGALLATFAICVPSFLVIYIISLFFDAFLSLTLIAKAFCGIRVAVVYLILSTGIKMLRAMKKTAFSVSVVLITALCLSAFSLFSLRFSSVFFILIAGAFGLFFYGIELLRLRGKTK